MLANVYICCVLQSERATHTSLYVRVFGWDVWGWCEFVFVCVAMDANTSDLLLLVDF